MRQKKHRQELAALGFPNHIPTDALRNQVRMYALNKIEHETIARVLDIDVGVLRYFYWRELSLTDAEVLARMTQNVLELAMQRQDLGVALKASESFLRSRSALWREPKAVDPQHQDAPLRVERLTLEQVEAALARLGTSTLDAGPGDPDRQDEPE